MNQPTLKYGCTALIGTNKSGNLKPNEYGYRRCCVGAMNYHNASGIYYNWERSKAAFDSSSDFMRRVTKGNLYGELEHPEWEPGWSYEEFVHRVRMIDGRNISHHISEIEFDFGEVNTKGQTVIVIYAMIKPDRDKGVFLESAFQNPCQNVCFSIRSLVTDRRIAGGKIDRQVDLPVTFDWVSEPGIDKAEKWQAPGLESLDFIYNKRAVDIDIPVSSVIAANDQFAKQAVGMESGNCIGLETFIRNFEAECYRLETPSVLSRW